MCDNEEYLKLWREKETYSYAIQDITTNCDLPRRYLSQIKKQRDSKIKWYNEKLSKIGVITNV